MITPDYDRIPKPSSERPPDGVCEECGLPMAPMWLRRLQKWAPPLHICETCQGLEEAKRQAAEVQRSILASGVSKRHAGYSFDRAVIPHAGESMDAFERRVRYDREGDIGLHDGNISACEALRDWMPRDGSVFLHGQPGSGKTMLVEVVAIRLLSIPLTWEPVPGTPVRGPDAVVRRRGGYSVVVTSEADLTARVRRRRAGLSDADGGEPHPLDAPKRCGTLILDDLGRSDRTAGRSATTSADVVEEVVDSRYRAGLPILATSNLTLARLGDPLGLRTVSRLEEMCAGRCIEVSGHWRTA